MTNIIAIAKEALELSKTATPRPWTIAFSERAGAYGIRPKDRRKKFSIMVNQACGRPSIDAHLAADREFITFVGNNIEALAKAVIDQAEELERYKAAWQQLRELAHQSTGGTMWAHQMGRLADEHGIECIADEGGE